MSRIRKTNSSLLFLPVEISDSGYYICKSSGPSEDEEITMLLLVESSLCPPHSDIKSAKPGTNDRLICGQEDIFTLNQTAEITWLKDCNPLGFHTERIRFSNVTTRDAGNYTCMITFSFEGKLFHASRTILLDVKKEPPLTDPTVIEPRNETIKVEPGEKAEFKCTVFVGRDEGSETETSVYWTVNNSLIDNYEQLKHSTSFEMKDQGLYGYSSLFISEVRPEFLHVPFSCIVCSPVHRDRGVVWLVPANHRDFHINLIICMAVPVVITGAVMYHVFKVDIVLALRGLRPLVASKTDADGKLYDAYVSYLHSEALCSPRFCLQVLPAVLERQHGYKLFIRGRDDLPGEGVHDVISNAISRSRRLIIVLSATNSSEEDPEDPVLLDQNQNEDQPDFERQIGLYDALIQNSLKVILVEIGKDIDYSLFPESVRYVKQKQGALRWTPTHGSPTAPPNYRFWKYLRYCMPPGAPTSHGAEQGAREPAVKCPLPW
ncbi:interleukin-1 receptor type 1-like [Megalops cyprinoides]|uniref:interleukin-1 receptor type 1-like n=1 Tax=Megalops cyprinoides TaxID=118141 RepID=UPI001863A04F|nr:interleukin-1 receptor type 1-like [Megalops cyprinoides]